MTPNVRGQQYSHTNIGKIRIHLLLNTNLWNPQSAMVKHTKGKS
jgi:hypothetical protein